MEEMYIKVSDFLSTSTGNRTQDTLVGHVFFYIIYIIYISLEGLLKVKQRKKLRINLEVKR